MDAKSKVFKSIKTMSKKKWVKAHALHNMSTMTTQDDNVKMVMLYCRKCNEMFLGGIVYVKKIREAR